MRLRPWLGAALGFALLLLQQGTVPSEEVCHLRVGMPVSRLAKWKTLIQMVAIGVLIVGDAGPGILPVGAIGEALLWVAALLTLLTGYDYLRAGLAHMTRAPRPHHAKTQHLA